MARGSFSPTRAAASAAELVAVCAVPAALAYCAAMQVEQTALLSMAVVACALLVFFVGYERRRPRLRDIMPVAVLAALAAAGRILFAPFPSFKPVSAIAIIAGVVFGRRAGFMVGALAALASNFFFGQGPWTPWQMYAWGMVGYGAGLLAQACSAPPRLSVVCAYGFASGFGYGFVLNLWSIVGFSIRRMSCSWRRCMRPRCPSMPCMRSRRSRFSQLCTRRGAASWRAYGANTP